MGRPLVLFLLSVTLLISINMQALAQGRPTLKMRGETEVKEPAPVSTPPEPAPLAKAEPSAPAIRVKFEGLKSISESDLLQTLREKRAMIAAQNVYRPAGIDAAAKVIKEEFKHQGFMNTSVEPRLDVSSQPPSITFVINEGLKAQIVEINFEGNEIFSDEQLLKEMKYTLEGNRATLPELDVDYDADEVDIDLRLVQQFMASRGYLRAKIGQPRAEDAGRNRKLVVPVDEGLLYRMGEIRIEGANQFSPEEVLDFLGVRPGDIADGRQIGAGLYERLKKAYADRGFIQYDGAIVPAFRHSANAQEGLVDFTITIEEGSRFRVRAIKFQGATRVPGSVLRDALQIRDGEIYNQSKLEEGLERLGQLCACESIDRQRDLDYRYNEEESLLDIVILIRELKDR
jgi:outer membrane protein insertion porin family